MSRICVDLRSLQDPNYASRGIGRHGLNLLLHAPHDLSLIGLCDPALPALPVELAGRFDRLFVNTGADLHADAFVQLSPLTHDPMFAARLLIAPDIVKLTAVYDFIPRHDPTLYLKASATRAAYAIRLRWLARYDVFCPISQTVGEELRALLALHPRAIRVTGAPVSDIFVRPAGDTQTDGRPPYLALLAGPEARKNPEVAIIAHARSAALQGARVGLCVAGNYPAAEGTRLQRLAADNGGDSDLVTVPGHLPDHELVALLSGAQGLICTSRDEGFSLPVVEGMALGLPVLVSDIPVHRELVTDSVSRFAPTDHQALAAAAEKLVFDPQYRSAALERQSSSWQRFAADKVARRFWGPLEEQLARRPGISAPAIARTRPRVALVTPVAPARTGIADHSAAIARELGPRVDLDIFTPTPSPWPVAGAAGVYPLSGFPHVSPRFDRVINVMGNSEFHLDIFRLLRRFGGACIAHDSRMLGFYRSLLGEAHTLKTASRELGRTVTVEELRAWLGHEGDAEARLLGEIADSSTRMIVHSREVADLIASRHQVRPTCIPFCIQRQPRPAELTPAGRQAARARLGIADSEIVVASFGHVNPSKAPLECVWALEMLKSWGIPATLHFVGGADGMPEGGGALRHLIDRLGLRDQVRLAHTHVSETDYRDYLVAANVALQLRTYDLGQVSGALSDCIAAGLPAVATRGLAASIDGPEELVSVVPNELSPLVIAEALLGRLESVQSPDRREAARLNFCEERSAARYAAHLCRALELEMA